MGRAVVGPGTDAFVYKVLIDSGGNTYILGRVQDGSMMVKLSWELWISLSQV